MYVIGDVWHVPLIIIMSVVASKSPAITGLFDSLFRLRAKETPNLRITGSMDCEKRFHIKTTLDVMSYANLPLILANESYAVLPHLPGASELNGINLIVVLTHWSRVKHICVSRMTNNGSDNGLPPGRRQAIIWTNVGILLIRTLGTNFSEILSEIHTYSFKKMHLKMSSAKWRPFCFGLNVLSKRVHL